VIDYMTTWIKTVWFAMIVQLCFAGIGFAQSGSPGAPAAQQGTGESRRRVPPRPPASPWFIHSTVSTGFASNVHFDQEDLDAFGAVVGSGVRYEGDDFTVSYKIAVHRYTNTTRWNRVSQLIAASVERDLSDKWEFHTEGQIGFKGTSEDRDIVDQDLEISPRLEYQWTPDRRLRLFTVHRLKRYNDAPETNAFKNYIGAEFRETLQPRRYWEIGGRYETNDEQADRGDYRRWTYWLEHAIPVTGRDTLLVQVRYRFRRYTARFVEIDDEDYLRMDHRWIPSIGWTRPLGPDFDLRVDYTYESNSSNDPDREYRAHLLWSGIGVRW